MENNRLIFRCSNKSICNNKYVDQTQSKFYKYLLKIVQILSNLKIHSIIKYKQKLLHIRINKLRKLQDRTMLFR